MIAVARPTFHDQVRDAKIAIIRAAAERHRGHRGRMAKDLGLQRTYLLRLIKDLGITNLPRLCGPCDRMKDGGLCRNHRALATAPAA